MIEVKANQLLEFVIKMADQDKLQKIILALNSYMAICKSFKGSVKFINAFYQY